MFNKDALGRIFGLKGLSPFRVPRYHLLVSVLLRGREGHYRSPPSCIDTRAPENCSLSSVLFDVVRLMDCNLDS